MSRQGVRWLYKPTRLGGWAVPTFHFFNSGIDFQGIRDLVATLIDYSLAFLMIGLPVWTSYNEAKTKYLSPSANQPDDL